MTPEIQLILRNQIVMMNALVAIAQNRGATEASHMLDEQMITTKRMIDQHLYIPEKK